MATLRDVDFSGHRLWRSKGALLIPNSALADQADTGVTEIEGSAEARALWEEAVRRAQQCD